MPYDDPILRELGGYFKAEEPGRRERADAWATACMAMGENAVKQAMQGRNDLGVMTISADTAGNSLIVWSNRAFASHIP